MNMSVQNGGEHTSSAEYLKEYAGLILDIATTIELLEKSPVPQSVTHVFTVETIGTPITSLPAIKGAIGDSYAASVVCENTFGEQSMTIEFNGEERSYRASRSTNSVNDNDAVFDIKPIDSFSALTGQQQTHRPITNDQDPMYIENYTHPMPLLSRLDFNRLLMSFTQAGNYFSFSDSTDKALQSLNPFESSFFNKFCEIAADTSTSHDTYSTYDFVSDDSAQLHYTQEDGQARYFQFQCTSATGDTLSVRGSITGEIQVEFPQHAVKAEPDLNYELIDTLISYPPTLAEMRYMRSLLKDENGTLPKPDPAEDLVSETDNFISENTIALEEIDERIESDREAAELNRAASAIEFDYKVEQEFGKNADDN